MFGVIFLYVLATNCGINAYCYRDEDDIVVELIGNQLRNNATAVDTVEVQNEDQCMDHCLYKGYCVSFNAIQEDHKVKCELFNITSENKTLERHVNSSYYEVHLTCQNSLIVVNVSGCGSNCSMKRDCVDWLQAGYSQSGVYEIDINGNLTKVYCDMQTEDGGWIRFYNRVGHSPVLCDKRKDDYEKGFGDFDKDYWLGVENIHQLTATGENLLYWKMFDWTSPIICSGFKIVDKSSGYQLETVSCPCIRPERGDCFYKCFLTASEYDNCNYYDLCRRGNRWYYVHSMMLKRDYPN
ncbi:angiopoietin-related protein 6-like [Hydractinia symbiolongicarpus]|uniref:angiopoietin-related protein 6-like n=1 Tax=Hydractinia symbiolongicarpus TaxID=13093 RepID=UPI00255100B7|nr:angiopoietin-related protein 6-like [Hydractinia symbiolongicarpus]XP_057308745.1 angiopoietin-related protein 6-like [Hydractinia symbiolongicarpus]